MGFTPAERGEFVRQLVGMAACYHQEMGKDRQFGYELGLNDLTLDAIKTAVARAIRECTFMPTPAELRRLAGEIEPATRAALAFEEFAKAVELVGGYRSVSFADPLINATVRNLGGWERCCDIGTLDDTDKFEVWLRKEFERVYSGLCRVGVNGENCAPLVGVLNRTNHGLGYETNGVQHVPTKLPGHRAGLIRGEIPQALPAPVKQLGGDDEIGRLPA